MFALNKCILYEFIYAKLKRKEKILQFCKENCVVIEIDFD